MNTIKAKPTRGDMIICLQFEKVKHFEYQENWLDNLLIAVLHGGRRTAS